MGERLNGIQEVSGSIPLISTKTIKSRLLRRLFTFIYVFFSINAYKKGLDKMKTFIKKFGSVAALILLLTLLTSCNADGESAVYLGADPIESFESEESEPEYSEPEEYDSPAESEYDPERIPQYRALWVIVPKVDADLEADGEITHVDTELTTQEILRVAELSKDFEKRVEDITDGIVDMVVDVEIMPEPLTQLKYDESFNCAVFDDVLPESVTSREGSYDCTFCFADLGGGKDATVGQNYWGLAFGGGGAYCRNYVFVQYTGEPTLYSEDGTYFPEEVWVHEWIHTLEFTLDGYEFVPSADGAETYGYSHDEGANSFLGYYSDILNHRVVSPDDPNEYLGVTPEAWFYIEDTRPQK